MELSLLLAKQILSLFLMGVVGYMIVRIGLLKTEDSQILSKLAVYVFCPCVVVDSFQIECTPSKTKGLLLAVAVSFALHILYISVVKVLKGPLHFNSIERASLIYSNSGNLVIPLVAATFGTKWVFYTSAYTAIQTIFVWTHGKSLLVQSEEKSWKSVLKNPNVIAIIIGMLLFALNIRLPSVLASTVSGLGTMIGPISMIVIGMLIGNVDLLWVFRQKRLYFICFFRLIVLPVLTIMLLKITGVVNYHPEARQILLIVLLAASSSVAATITQMVQVFGGDAKYASVINVMSVIFCVLTMPLMVFLYEIVIS